MEQEKIEKVIKDLVFSSSCDAETAALSIALQLISEFPPKYSSGTEEIKIAQDIASKIGAMARSISPVRYKSS